MIDASIAMGVKPIQIDSPMNALAQMMKIQNVQQENQLGQMKMDEYKRGTGADNALAQLIASGKSGADVATGLASQGYGKQSMDYIKNLQAADKGKAETAHLGAQTGKLNAETLNLHVTQSRDQLSAINDPQGGAAWVTAMYNNPELAPLIKMSGKTLEQQIAAIPQDQQGFADWKMRSSLGAEKLVQMTMPDANAQLTAQTSTANNAATNATSRANNSATIANSARTANMADARSRESTAATMSKPFEVSGPDGLPVLVQQDKQGNIKPVSGYSPKSAADKPLTDAQSKAALFGSRMQSSNEVLASLEKDGTTTSIPGARAGFGIGATLNTVSTAKQQQLNQAKRDFVNAVLRRESGAVIADSEFSNAEQQYFPQVGDSKEVIKQKNNNRAIAIRGIQAEVPKAQRGVLKEIQGGATGDFSGAPEKTVVKTGKLNGRVVHQYSDGTTDYAN